MKNCKLKLVAMAVLLSLGNVGGALAAADTASAMRGKITGPQGNPAANVKVFVKHLPSGTVNEFITNSTGTFIGKGLRIGGPYEVTIDSEKFQNAQLNNIFLQLGDTYRLVRQLEADNMERIAVTGSRFVEATGSTSVFGQDLVDNMPSLNRDMKDIARLNPLATLNGNGNLTFAGGNPRSNSFTVDGIGQNDDFGLNYGGYPTSQPPISLDSIAQISVEVVPFSVKKGGFDGGSINAVTKSGTNEFHGTTFYEMTDPSLAGEGKNISQVFEDNSPVLDDDFHRTYEINKADSIDSSKRFGASFGGPIIKDELFFFVNYEDWNETLKFDQGFKGSGAGNEYDISQEQFDEFSEILSETYGLSDSLYGDPKDTDKKWLIKLDWNINDDHRLAFTYQSQENDKVSNFSAGGSSLNLASSVYTYNTKSNNIIFKLYSDWSANFSSEFGVSLKNVKATSNTNADFGSVTVHTTDSRAPSINFGNDAFRHANESENKNLKVNFDGSYLYGEHDISFGFEVERLNLYNLFSPNSQGSWNFDNFEMFKNRNIGNYDFSYGNAFSNNADDTAYDNVRFTTVLYAEDTFYLTDDIEITAGLRYERIDSDDKPTLNTNFLETYGVSNQENLDGLDVFMPRISLKWYANSQLTVRGGIGRFTGGIPNVWYNGPFTADGVTYVSAQSSVINDYYANGTVVDFTGVPQAIQDSLTPGAGSTSYIDPNFVLPTDWRAQIATDYIFAIPGLGDNFAWTTELTYKKKKDEPVWKDSSRSPLDENGSINYAADGERIIQTSIYAGTDFEDNYDIELTNAAKDGRSIILSTSLSKEWDNGLSMQASYAYQDVTENTGGTNSRNSSNYSNTITVNRNQEQVGRGYYETEHSFKLNLAYKREFFEGYNTKINLYFERRSGRPLSWLMGFFRDGDLGDQPAFNTFSPYLPYIPSGPEDTNVDWTANNAVSWDELSTILDRAGIDACGCILARGAATQPWVTELDLSIKQEIPGFSDGHKGELYFTIDNFANLLNSGWGEERNARYPKAIYDFAGLSDDGKYQLAQSFRGYDVRNYSGIDPSSTWKIKVGVRYSF